MWSNLQSIFHLNQLVWLCPYLVMSQSESKSMELLNWQCVWIIIISQLFLRILNTHHQFRESLYATNKYLILLISTKGKYSVTIFLPKQTDYSISVSFAASTIILFPVVESGDLYLMRLDKTWNYSLVFSLLRLRERVTKHDGRLNMSLSRNSLVNTDRFTKTGSTSTKP